MISPVQQSQSFYLELEATYTEDMMSGYTSSSVFGNHDVVTINLKR